MNKPVWIIGLQKSGTSLLSHLLEESGVGVSHSGRVEDTTFWGDRPSFSPTEWPAGMIYQHYCGEQGHAIGKDWAAPDIRLRLSERLREDMTDVADDKVVFGKNPYNTVRIPWVRALFPESIIVAMIRSPFSNTYSLWKRFIPGAHTASPEHGWWGVKPPGWKTLVQDDKIKQIASQWVAVNQSLMHNRDLIDLVIPYHELCTRPEHFVKEIIALSTNRKNVRILPMPDLSCFDDEYRTGSCLMSKNKFRTGTLQPDKGKVELAPFGKEEMDTITHTCGTLSMQMGVSV